MRLLASLPFGLSWTSDSWQPMNCVCCLLLQIQIQAPQLELVQNMSKAAILAKSANPETFVTLTWSSIWFSEPS
ncbi:unnamed protein product [Allacma fusca]|uniref:Uncharacterized protein n=1 Tax=Allacma fusca TaxID=39272 RepID=A0A8J2L990_9HEXA|nr:unnamed protein product [Allacma fusca]